MAVSRGHPDEGVAAVCMDTRAAHCLSLWPIDDDATRRWMRELYEARFVRGLGAAQAVRAASIAELHRRRTAGLSTHPFYWGAFIATGEWR